MNIHDRINQEIQFAREQTEKSKKTILAAKALGAVDIAVEFELITYTEWENYIKDIFEML